MIIFWVGVALCFALIPRELRRRRQKQPFNYRMDTLLGSIATGVVGIGILVALDRPPSALVLLFFAGAWCAGVGGMYILSRYESKSYERRQKDEEQHRE